MEDFVNKNYGKDWDSIKGKDTFRKDWDIIKPQHKDKNDKYRKYLSNAYLPEDDRLDCKGKYLSDEKFARIDNRSDAERNFMEWLHGAVNLILGLSFILIFIKGCNLLVLASLIAAPFIYRYEEDVRNYMKEREYRIKNNLTVMELDEYAKVKEKYGDVVAEFYKRYCIASKNYSDDYMKLYYDMRYIVNCGGTVRTDENGCIIVEYIYNDTEQLKEIIKKYPYKFIETYETISPDNNDPTSKGKPETDKCDEDDDPDVIVIPPEDIEVVYTPRY